MVEITVTARAETKKDALDLLSLMDVHLSWHMNEKDHFELKKNYGVVTADVKKESCPTERG